MSIIVILYKIQTSVETLVLCGQKLFDANYSSECLYVHQQLAVILLSSIKLESRVSKTQKTKTWATTQVWEIMEIHSTSENFICTVQFREGACVSVICIYARRAFLMQLHTFSSNVMVWIEGL